ncbi:MAG: hypothetical protein ACK2UR_11485 [Candidatus Promineifilaceae bacterium]|jgi:hypothetical protein
MSDIHFFNSANTGFALYLPDWAVEELNGLPPQRTSCPLLHNLPELNVT